MASPVHRLDRLLVLQALERTPQSRPADFQEIAQHALGRQPVLPVPGGDFCAEDFQDLSREDSFLG